MEPVSIKFDERSLKNIGKIMQKFGYSTKTEFKKRQKPWNYGLKYHLKTT